MSNKHIFAVLLVRFLLYEIRAATSFEVRALHHLQLLHTVPRWRKIVKNVIYDNKMRQPCAKPEDILNASIQVIIHMTLYILMISGYRHCLDVCSEYILEDPVQVRFYASQNLLYIQSTICVYKRQSSWHWNYGVLEPDRLQHGHPVTCVITQQNSSATFVSLYFVPIKRNPACILKVLLFQFFKCYIS